MSTIFDEMIAEMESNNLALEALLADMPTDNDQMDPATEGLFSKPKTLDEMLANVKKTVDKKCKTSEDCEDWLAKVKNEEEKFNTAIKALQEATKKYQSDNDQKALQATCKPILKNLKKTCNILSMKDISEDAGNITEEELKKLRDFLVGAKKIINDKAAECNKGDCDHADGEGAEECGNSCESFLAMLQGNDQVDIVTEAVGGIRLTMANWFDKMATKAKEHAQKLKYSDKDGNKGISTEKDPKSSRYIAAWEGIAKFCEGWANRLRASANKSMDKAKEAAEQKAAKAAMDKVKEDINKQEAAEGAAANESLLYDLIDEEIAIESAFAYYDAVQSNVSMESAVGGYTIEDFMTFAMEGIVNTDQKQKWNIKGGEIAKQLRSTIKEARQAVKSKEYDQAITLYKKAIKGYQGLLATAKKIPDKQTYSGSKFHDGSDSYKGSAKVAAINWCNQQISACQAAIQKVQDKKMKIERKASESAIEDAFEDFELTLESLMGKDRAIESDFDDDDPLAGLDEVLSED